MASSVEDGVDVVSVEHGGVKEIFATALPNATDDLPSLLRRLHGVMGESGEEWAAQLGVQFDVRNLEAEAWFQQYVLEFADPISDTSSEVIDNLITQGMAEGWSV